jgi:hypothetical protein
MSLMCLWRWATVGCTEERLLFKYGTKNNLGPPLLGEICFSLSRLQDVLKLPLMERRRRGYGYPHVCKHQCPKVKWESLSQFGSLVPMQVYLTSNLCTADAC